MFDRFLNTFAAWALALLWILPLAYAVWTAIHPSAYEANFDPVCAADDGELCKGLGGCALSRATSSTPSFW
jgi:hypothetical protein